MYMQGKTSISLFGS